MARNTVFWLRLFTMAGIGHCACVDGWAGELCSDTEHQTGLPAGVSQEQHDQAVAAGVDPSADPVCFTAAYVTVPDDPYLSISAGQGAVYDVNYDPSMPSANRCDAPPPPDQVLCQDGGSDCCASSGWGEPASCIDGYEPTHIPTMGFSDLGGCPNFECIATTAGDVSISRNGSHASGPFGLQHGTTGWYRLPVGKAMPTAPPGGYRCGTSGTGWLSGWPAEAEGQPNERYTTPADGSLPPPLGSPPAEGTVCFHTGGEESLPWNALATTCFRSTRIRAVSCGAFALWELSPVPTCHLGYCLASA